MTIDKLRNHRLALCLVRHRCKDMVKKRQKHGITYGITCANDTRTEETRVARAAWVVRHIFNNREVERTLTRIHNQILTRCVSQRRIYVHTLLHAYERGIALRD